MKPFYKSRTLWLSAAMLASYLLAWPELTRWVDPQTLATATAFTAFLLRLLTEERVTLR